MSGVGSPELVRGHINVETPYEPNSGEMATVTLHLTCHPADSGAVAALLIGVVEDLHREATR